VAGTCECGNEPLGSIKCLTSSEPARFSSRSLFRGVSMYVILGWSTLYDYRFGNNVKPVVKNLMSGR
jgi:hypothetical protein